MKLCDFPNSGQTVVHDLPERSYGLGLVVKKVLEKAGLVKWGWAHLIAAELYAVSTWDPLSLSVAAVALALSGFIAAVIPATRAASVSPVDALRGE